MQKNNEPNLKIMIEDLIDLLLKEDDYNHTMEMLKLTEDENLIFKRARLQLTKKDANPLIIKKAYQIFIAKSFHNKGFNSHDSQNILGQEEKNDSISSSIFSSIKSNLEYIIIAFIVALILKKLFF